MFAAASARVHTPYIDEGVPKVTRQGLGIALRRATGRERPEDESDRSRASGPERAAHKALLKRRCSERAAQKALLKRRCSEGAAENNRIEMIILLAQMRTTPCPQLRILGSPPPYSFCTIGSPRLLHPPPSTLHSSHPRCLAGC